MIDECYRELYVPCLYKGLMIKNTLIWAYCKNIIIQRLVLPYMGITSYMTIYGAIERLTGRNHKHDQIRSSCES